MLKLVVLGLIFPLIEGVPHRRIAIVGGGIGGTSAAYFVSELLGKSNIHIDLYEKNEIGGRLTTVKINGNYYEAGGAIIHPNNKYMTDFLKLFGLKKRIPINSNVGVFDGNNFVFVEDSKWFIVNTFKLLWRYGLSVLNLHYYIKNMLGKFERIYDFQERKICYENTTDLLNAMDEAFVDDLGMSTKLGFSRDGFTENVIDELVATSIVVNYGQYTNVQKFVGEVSVAGATSGLFSVHGGNNIVPQKLLLESGAKVMKSLVTEIELKSNTDSYIVHYDKSESNTYDAVILAMPITSDTQPVLKFSNFPEELTFEGKYHRTVSTIVHGQINHTYFGFKNPEDVVDEICCSRNDMKFNSIGRIYPVDYTEQKNDQKSEVWKIFSQSPLSEKILNELFTDVKEVNIKDWLAYPHYTSNLRSDKFILHNNLYHLNAVEWTASAMEMSVISAKNIALLLYNNWNSSDLNHGNVKEEL